MSLQQVMVADLVPDAAPDLEIFGHMLALGLSELGLKAQMELLDGWARISLEVGLEAYQFGILEPERAGLSKDAIDLRFGFSLSFGVPDGGLLDSIPDVILSLPAVTTVGELLSIVQGKVSPGGFVALENFSARHALSVPIEKFPKSVLLAVGEAGGEAGWRMEATRIRYDLWTQDGGKLQIHSLVPTNNPHEAAREANELGYWPTVYRCLSGRFVCFKSTSGGVFI
ncbi:hypothetical protein ACSVIJ_04030 [Pseudomonas sp. NCHU5208]|uniref:hypothetical protein n=1 Tax=unclassified Pseudomonas TaxID=196821 RepID=UPI003F9504FD